MQKLTNEQITVIWNEYKDEQDWQRHNESQRATLTQILLGIAAALAALFPREPRAGDWLIPAFLIGIGVFGILVIFKYWERFEYHVVVAREYRKVIDSFFREDNGQPEGKEFLFIATLEAAKAAHGEGWLPLLKESYFRQHWLWIGLFAAITLLGVALLQRVPNA
jgi:hypothetical protein